MFLYYSHCEHSRKKRAGVNRLEYVVMSIIMVITIIIIIMMMMMIMVDGTPNLFPRLTKATCIIATRFRDRY